MPKRKTNKSAKKRFWVTKSGKVKRCQAGKSHRMVSFSGKRVRKLRKQTLVSPAALKVVRQMLAVD